mmetsp:Transcript_28464/g.75156  ORF Transcript_28464/g.75156 Transcript_28464/m.75156 type:complete len:84 (-) Transcript_28464:47-298(-)
MYVGSAGPWRCGLHYKFIAQWEFPCIVPLPTATDRLSSCLCMNSVECLDASVVVNVARHGEMTPGTWTSWMTNGLLGADFFPG